MYLSIFGRKNKISKVLISVGIRCKQEKDLFNWENGKEVRTFVKYFCKKEMSPKEIHDDFIKTIGDEFPSNSTVKKWAAEFRRGRKSVEDYERSDPQNDDQRSKEVQAWYF